MRRLLEYQADRIEMVLASHKLPGRIFGGVVTPRFVRFRLVPPWGTKLSRITGLAEEIALAVGAPACRIYRQGDALHVEVPRQAAGTVRLLPLCRRLADVPPCTAVLGLDEEGVPLLLRLPSPQVAHVLVAGTTGSGKTALARTMITSLAIHNRLGEVQMVLIDPKASAADGAGRGFAPFAGLPHLLVPLVREVAQAREVLARLVAEMARRDRLGVSEPRIVVFVDELADLMVVGGSEMERLLTRLSQRGREAGVHLVASTQKPTVGVVGSVVKSNFPVRLVGSVTSAEDARLAAGVGGTGAERLGGNGDFVVVTRGRVVRMQAAYVSEREIGQVVERLRAGGRRSRRWAATGTEGRGGDGGAAGWLRERLRRVK